MPHPDVLLLSQLLSSQMLPALLKGANSTIFVWLRAGLSQNVLEHHCLWGALLFPQPEIDSCLKNLFGEEYEEGVGFSSQAEQQDVPSIQKNVGLGHIPPLSLS